MGVARQRAVCGDGVAVLDNVLKRMEQHMHKKSPQLRALSAWADDA